MVNWIRQFSHYYTTNWRHYHKDVPIYLGFFYHFSIPSSGLTLTIVIKTSTSWWKKCTGNSAVFGNMTRLWITNWDSSPGELPAGWQWVS